MKKIALFICSHDGISCRYAGVGTAASGYLKGIKQLRKIVSDKYSLTVHAITGKYKPNSYTYNQDLLDENRAICKKTGGDVHECLNNSDGTYQYGDVSSWYTASSASAQIITDILSKNFFDLVIIIGLDTPYAKTAFLVKKQLWDYKGKIIGFWTPHSTSLIHERGNFNPERINWEISTVKEINSMDLMFITYLNEYMYDHLRIDYRVLDTKLVPLLNGIVHEDVPYYSETEITKTLQKYKIPTDKNLLISFGRGAEYKGFDIFLKAIKSLSNNNALHFVLQCSFYDNNDPYLSQLKVLSSEIKNLTFIPEFSYELPRMLLQWKNTQICAVLSENEPGAFIPAEIRVYGQAICLVSDKDGLPCQIKDGIDGFITSIKDPKEVALTLKRILDLNPQEIASVRSEGVKLIKNKFDIVMNFSESMLNIIERNV